MIASRAARPAALAAPATAAPDTPGRPGVRGANVDFELTDVGGQAQVRIANGALELPVQSVCADSRVQHGELPRDRLVQQMVLAELAAGDPVQLGPADCARLS